MLLAFTVLTFTVTGCHSSSGDQRNAAAKLSPQDALIRRVMALPRPSTHEMDKVDAALTGRPCIGDIADWTREYSFETLPAAPLFDKDRIRFLLIDARGDSSRATRTALFPASNIRNIDLASTATGTFKPSTGEVIVDQCMPREIGVLSH